LAPIVFFFRKNVLSLKVNIFGTKWHLVTILAHRERESHFVFEMTSIEQWLSLCLVSWLNVTLQLFLVWLAFVDKLHPLMFPIGTSVKSGDCGGHSTAPLRPIHRPGRCHPSTSWHSSDTSANITLQYRARIVTMSFRSKDINYQRVSTFFWTPSVYTCFSIRLIT
jgi:hypothetical protein